MTKQVTAFVRHTPLSPPPHASVTITATRKPNGFGEVVAGEPVFIRV